MTEEEQVKKVLGLQITSPIVRSKVRFMLDLLHHNPKLSSSDVYRAMMEHFGGGVENILYQRVRFVLGLSNSWPKRKGK